jgi:hypothetical protein
MRTRFAPLGDVIEAWPSKATTLEELAHIPPDQLKAELENSDEETQRAVWALRAQARQLINVTQKGDTALYSPKSVLEALKDGRLRPRGNWWTIYPLGEDHRRIAAPYKDGGSRFLVKVQSKFPKTVADLELEVSRHTRYLAIWGGDTNVITIPGVVERIVSFGEDRHLDDVLLWDGITLWSVRFAVGDEDGTRVEFPDETKVVEVAQQIWKEAP